MTKKYLVAALESYADDEEVDLAALEERMDERFPQGYAEIEYPDMETAEAAEGARFDDWNYLRHFER